MGEMDLYRHGRHPNHRHHRNVSFCLVGLLLVPGEGEQQYGFRGNGKREGVMRRSVRAEGGKERRHAAYTHSSLSFRSLSVTSLSFSLVLSLALCIAPGSVSERGAMKRDCKQELAAYLAKAFGTMWRVQHRRCERLRSRVNPARRRAAPCCVFKGPPSFHSVYCEATRRKGCVMNWMFSQQSL